MWRAALLLALLAAAPGTARAACPTAEAMDGRGVLLTTARGDIELHQRTREGVIQIAVNFGGGDGTVLEMQHGVYLIRRVALVDGVLDSGSEQSFMGPRTAAAWQIPTPVHTWQNAERNGGSAASGGTKTVSIGQCRYAGFDVSVRHSYDPQTVETFTYLPEFGIGLRVRTEGAGTEQTTRYAAITAY